MQISAIILAGGKSTRMGTDKALIQFNGESLLGNALKLCKPFFHPVFISSNNPEHEFPGCRRINDVFPGCGPIGGIFSCLLQTQTDWNFVLSVDSTFVEPAFVSFLVSETGDWDAIIPVHRNGIEPLIGIYHRQCLPVVEKHIKSGNYKMQDLFDELRVHFVDAQNWVERYPQIFTNFNSPEDLPFET